MPVGHEANRMLAGKRARDKEKLKRAIRIAEEGDHAGGVRADTLANITSMPKHRARSLLLEMVVIDKMITRYFRAREGKTRSTYFYRLNKGDRQEEALF